jgi:hypothetical protein
LIIDAALSLARQWILRPKNRPRNEKPVLQTAGGAEPHRTGWYDGLTPWNHFFILWIPVGALPFLAISRKDADVTPWWLIWIGNVGVALLLYAWYQLYKRRLLRAPLASPMSRAHLPQRLQLKDTLKSIQWFSVAHQKGWHLFIGGLVFAGSLGLWDFLNAKLGYPQIGFSPALFCYVISWNGLASRLNRYAVETLEREIERLSENS